MIIGHCIDHVINYSSFNILAATDNSIFRLKIKETIKIKEYFAYNSLNGNTGSFLVHHNLLNLFEYLLTVHEYVVCNVYLHYI